MAHKKNPSLGKAGLRPDALEKLQEHHKTPPDSLALQREMQALVCGLIATVDRLAESVTRMASIAEAAFPLHGSGGACRGA